MRWGEGLYTRFLVWMEGTGWDDGEEVKDENMDEDADEDEDHSPGDSF